MYVFSTKPIRPHGGEYGVDTNLLCSMKLTAPEKDGRNTGNEMAAVHLSYQVNRVIAAMSMPGHKGLELLLPPDICSLLQGDPPKLG
jgi:hypothetical protein